MRLNQMVQNITVILGALGSSFGAASVLADPSLALFGWAILAGAGGMVTASAVLRLTHRHLRAPQGDSS